jgi:transcriptional regulator with XRE-family HTH domain
VLLSRTEQARLKAFGANVRRERSARGLSQERLAALASISTRNLQKVEAGQLNILLTTVLRVQAALGCPWKRLMPSEVGAKAI